VVVGGVVGVAATVVDVVAAGIVAAVLGTAWAP
jgi:hypothetical protein